MKHIVILLLAITIVACSEDEPQMMDNDPQILNFTNVELDNKDYSEHGYFLSSSTGEVFLKSELFPEVGSKVDVVYIGNPSFGTAVFTDPVRHNTSEGNTVVPNATATLFDSFENGITDSIYNDLGNNSDFDNLTVEDDQTVTLLTGFPRYVLFQNANGKKGVIKLTTANLDRLVIEYKVQK